MEENRLCIGIDAHSQKHVAHFLRSDGSIAHKPLEFAQSNFGFSTLKKALIKLSKEHPDITFHCGIEAAGPYWVALAVYLQNLSFTMDVSVINPSIIKGHKKTLLQKSKTDYIDARVIADYVLRYKPKPTEYLSAVTIALRQLARGREFFTEQLTSVVNQLRSQLAIAFPEISHRSTHYSDALLSVLHRFPSAHILANATDEQLKEIRLLNHSKNVGLKKSSYLRTLARESIGVEQDSAYDFLIQRLIEQIWYLNKKSEDIKQELIAYYRKNFFHTKLHTICGIGELSAALMLAEILDIDRFETVARFIGYLGFYPELRCSAGKSIPELKMTKKGNKYLRHTFFCCVISAIRFNPVLQRHYHIQLSRGKKRMVAIGSCMRKLAAIVFGVMKTGKDFDPLYCTGMKIKTSRKLQEIKEELSRNNDVVYTVVNATLSASGQQIESNSSSEDNTIPICSGKNRSLQKNRSRKGETIKIHNNFSSFSLSLIFKRKQEKL